MRTLLTLLIILVLALGGAAQDKSKITPTLDPTAGFKVYIPKDLEDAFIELEKMISPSLLNEMRLRSETEMIGYHHGFGTWLRNNWGLWADSRLAQYFKQLGITHPDDMSGIILISFWRHLQSEPIKLEDQVEYYKEYYRKAAEKEVSITLVPETAMNSPLRTSNGETIRLSNYRTKVVVLAWLDTSCRFVDKGCRMVSSLVKLKSDYLSQDLEVIGLVGTYPGSNSRRASNLLKRFVVDRGINFPVVWDDDEFSYEVSSYAQFGYLSFPQIFVISPEGHIVKRVRGFNPQTDPTLLRQAIAKAVRQN